MTKFTPTTDGVRDSLVYLNKYHAKSFGDVDLMVVGSETASQFDRMIAEVERAAAEEAWDTGVSDFQQAHGMDSAEPWPYLRDNPYRRNEGERN